jgi:probable F420-dependent oxidoreductase
MKIRIGVGVSGWPFRNTQGFRDFVDLVETSGLDSIWFSERLRNTSPSLEPMTALSMIAGRTRRIKFGMSVMVLPARDPTVLAREIATLDFLSDGRLLPAFGLGLNVEAEWAAIGRTPEHRGAMTDEAVQLMRRLWSEDAVTHAGRFYRTQELTIQPKPKQHPMPVWFGGRTPAAYRRVGRLGDGFLGSFQSAMELAQAVRSIRDAAEQSGRHVPDDHFGTIVPFHFGDSDVSEALATLGRRLDPRSQPASPLDSYLAWRTPDAVRRRIDEYVAVGVSKFVFRPLVGGAEVQAQFEQLAETVVAHYHR